MDAADATKMSASKSEFNNLIAKPQLDNIPILVLANKNDLPGALTAEELIDTL